MFFGDTVYVISFQCISVEFISFALYRVRHSTRLCDNEFRSTTTAAPSAIKVYQINQLIS